MSQEKFEAYTAIATVLGISAVSGVISIFRRISQGHAAGVFWFISEFMAAILCGYLAYDAFPVLNPYMPDWVTELAFVAFCAHMGGRLLQVSESALYAKLPWLAGDRRNRPGGPHS